MQSDRGKRCVDSTREFMPDTHKQVDALNDLFTNEFKYSTDYYQIPSEKWQTGLMRKISDFMWQYDSPDCLAIIYYGGHGYEGRETKQFKLAA